MQKNIRNLKVCYRSVTRQGSGFRAYDYARVPSITLSGKWLEQLGFGIGDAVQVECSDGRLVITKAEEE